MEMIHLIIDIIARVVVPLLVPVVVYLLGQKPVKKLFDSRRENIEKQFREYARGYSDKDQEFMEKTLKEVFSKPSMRWYR